MTDEEIKQIAEQTCDEANIENPFPLTDHMLATVVSRQLATRLADAAEDEDFRITDEQLAEIRHLVSRSGFVSLIDYYILGYLVRYWRERAVAIEHEWRQDQ